MDARNRLSIVVGLLVAWGGTALLVSPIMLRPGTSSLLLQCLGQAALWLLLAVVIGIVVLWEKQPLASLWLRPFDLTALAWAGVLVSINVVVLFPFTEWVRHSTQLPGYSQGMEQALALPVWLRIVAVVTAGVVEETLFRGYAVTRLIYLTRSRWIAAVLATAVFAALHLPVWGPGPALAFLLGGLATTAFFIWRRDLLAMVIAHVALDAWALVITPFFSRWWS